MTRRLVEPTKDSVAHSKIHSFYTSCNNPSAFARRKTLKRPSKSSYRRVHNYSNCSETYTSFKQTKNRFPRLKVQRFRLIKSWSIDLADMQRLSRYNHGVNFILVAVDNLSRFVWALPLKKKTAAECENALQKILEALCLRNYCQKAMMKPKTCQTKSSYQPKPENIWVDKGREFAGEFSKFCKKNNINVYSTHGENKTAFAERNIRSLKALFFKFLHENNTDTYIENLQQFVNVLNSRVNHITKLALKNVHKNDVPYLISIQICNRIRQPNFKTGQQVKKKRKIETFHQSYRIQFIEEVFTIATVTTLNPPTYNIKDANNQLIQGKFYEAELTRLEQ